MLAVLLAGRGEMVEARRRWLQGQGRYARVLAIVPDDRQAQERAVMPFPEPESGG